MTDLPETIKYDSQPYMYGATLGHLRWDTDFQGRPILHGVILEGTEYAYLFGRSAGKDATGRHVYLYGVQDFEIKRGHIVKVAC